MGAWSCTSRSYRSSARWGPLEFAFLADAYLRRRGLRDRVELVFVTPLYGAFTKPIASARLGGMLEERGIALETDFMVERVEPESRTPVSYDEREIPYDLLVTTPVNMGVDFVARSGLGDELNCVPVDRHTLLSTRHDTIFAVGDAADLPTSKAGSTAHFSIELFDENFVRHIHGEEITAAFDGHANCSWMTMAGKIHEEAREDYCEQGLALASAALGEGIDVPDVPSSSS